MHALINSTVVDFSALFSIHGSGLTDVPFVSQRQRKCDFGQGVQQGDASATVLAAQVEALEWE